MFLFVDIVPDVLHILRVTESCQLDYVVIDLLTNLIVGAEQKDLVIFAQLLAQIKLQLGVFPECLYGCHALYDHGLVGCFDHHSLDFIFVADNVILFLQLDWRYLETIDGEQHSGRVVGIVQ